LKPKEVIHQEFLFFQSEATKRKALLSLIAFSVKSDWRCLCLSILGRGRLLFVLFAKIVVKANLLA